MASTARTLTKCPNRIPDIRRLLGVDGDLGKPLGLDNKWGYNAVKQVGNFGEIWDRTMTPMGIPRGINKVWKGRG